MGVFVDFFLKWNVCEFFPQMEVFVNGEGQAENKLRKVNKKARKKTKHPSKSHKFGGYLLSLTTPKSFMFYVPLYITFHRQLFPVGPGPAYARFIDKYFALSNGLVQHLLGLGRKKGFVSQVGPEGCLRPRGGFTLLHEQLEVFDEVNKITFLYFLKSRNEKPRE